MKLNCKQGDLAIIVKSKAGNEGKIVRCLRYVGRTLGMSRDDYWKVDQQVNCTCIGTGKFAGYTSYVSDAWMKPLENPSEDEIDEMLVLLGSPHEANETAKA